MRTVSMINFKGGVGKTTLSFHLAAYLSRESKVLLIDVDHQSSLSIVVLGDILWAKLVSEGKTVNTIFESFTNRKVVLPGNEIIVTNPIFARSDENEYYRNFYPNLDFVSAQFELDDTEIDLAATSFSNPVISEWEKRTLLASWLDQVGAQDKYDYVVIDCPPATKIVSQNALAASNCYVIPVIPDDLSSRGVTHFRGLVTDKIDGKLDFFKTSARLKPKDVPINYVATTKLAGIVPYLVAYAGNAASGFTNVHTEQIASLRQHWKKDVTRPVGKRYTGIVEAVNAGFPVWNWSHNVTKAIENMMTDICSDLKTRIDAT